MPEMIVEDLLTEVSVQNLPTIRWFKNDWMDFVLESNDKGDFTQFSIAYHEQDRLLNIEWTGQQLHFSDNEVNQSMSADAAKETLLLLNNFGTQIPQEIIEFVTIRLSSVI
jgi:hypothetical protein